MGFCIAILIWRKPIRIKNMRLESSSRSSGVDVICNHMSLPLNLGVVPQHRRFILFSSLGYLGYERTFYSAKPGKAVSG